MIRLYAVDPESLGRWGDMWKLLHDKVGLGEGRLIMRFPENWYKLVYKAMQGSNCSDNDKKRIVERLTHFKKALIKQQCSLQVFTDRNWIEQASAHFDQLQLDAILTERETHNTSKILTPDQAYDGDPRWTVIKGRVIARTPEAIAECLCPLASISNELLFVDPYLSGKSGQMKVLLEVLIAAGFRNRPFSRIEIHCMKKDADEVKFKADMAAFENAIQERVLMKSSHPHTIKVYCWDQRGKGTQGQGDAMHPRYLLTEKGGIDINYGFDWEGGKTTDVTLLDANLYEYRWKDYQPDTTPFDLIHKLEVSSHQ